MGSSVSFETVVRIRTEDNTCIEICESDCEPNIFVISRRNRKGETETELYVDRTELSALIIAAKRMGVR